MVSSLRETETDSGRLWMHQTLPLGGGLMRRMNYIELSSTMMSYDGTSVCGHWGTVVVDEV